MKKVLAAIVLAASTLSFATPQLRDATDLWINANESGWGLNVFHQGDTLFASLFVYGPDGQPKWYTASNLVGGNGSDPSPDRRMVYTGPLFESTGTWFGAVFDESKVTRRQVGTMTFDVGPASANLDYTIDGVRVTKQVTRFTFRATNLTGDYVGYMVQPGSSMGGEVRDAMTMTIQDNGSSVHMATASDTRGMCSFDGTRFQNGQYEGVAGTYSCGTTSGQWNMTVDPATDGFTGSFSGNGIGGFWGRIAAARRQHTQVRDNGYRNDLYLRQGESGWGLNVIEQGDTVFGTLFVYDRQGKPHWYSAPSLVRNDPVGDTTTYTGPLQESTGPFYGTEFNPGAVTRRQVGTMYLQGYNDGSAYLSYDVDGVHWERTILRYAFKSNSLSGRYAGHLTPDTAYPGNRTSEAIPISISIQDAGGNFSMATSGADGVSCNDTSPALQIGSLRWMMGTYGCSNGQSGSFDMQNAVVTFNGFTARFRGNGIAEGHIEGARLDAN